MTEYVKMFREAMVKHTKECLINENQEVTFAGYCATVDLVKDFYLAFIGATDTSLLDNDNLHDWANDIVAQMQKGVIHD